MAAFLSVERSLTGRRWTGPPAAADRAAEALAREADLPLPVARLLATRSIPAEEAAAHLDPRLRDLLPDPRSLRDMDIAAARLAAAVTGAQRIAVFADYDVDGAASAALLLGWLAAQGQQATLYVPDRIDEGYGPNVPAMTALARDHDLILCVDCGTLSHGPLAAAAGADVVILDHHLAAETLPPALACVNPNRQDETGTLAHLCAAGVTFLALVEANRILRTAGRPVPDLMAMTDLVALATVADVAPLTGVNRAFVRTGLAVMARRDRPGLVALADAAGLDRPPDAHHLGFVLGPRVNAGGRIGRADLGARLLATRDPAEAARLAADLDRLNAERRAIEAAVRAEALAQAESRGTDAPLVWAAGQGWHPGVVGIVAAALKEATNRPAVVIALDGDTGKGSGRSVAGVDLGAAVQRAAAEGLLIKGGGHRMAAGLTVARDMIPAAMDRLAALLARQGAGAAGPADLPLDGLLMPRAATAELVAGLDRAGPFGAGAPAPRFAVPALQILSARALTGGHLRLTAADDTGHRLAVIAFGAADGPIGRALLAAGGTRFHLAGQIEINTWQGRQSVQLRLEDASPAT
jgi:single-stranded-DNA-specific exonuclease